MDKILDFFKLRELEYRYIFECYKEGHGKLEKHIKRNNDGSYGSCVLRCRKCKFSLKIIKKGYIR